jgi:hypothetical protein
LVIVRGGFPYYPLMLPVQLEYTAPTGCPTQAEFVAFVASRGGDFANPGPKTRARTMTVTLRRETSEHSGALELGLDDMATDARQLRGQTCAEVAEALAVVAAIALRGPEEGSDSAAPPAPPAAVEPVAPPEAKPRPQPAVAELPKPPDTRLQAIGVWGDETVSVTAGPLQIKRSFMGTLSGGVVLGPIPNVVLPRYDFTWTGTNSITTPQGSNYLIGNVFGGQWSFLGIANRRDGTYSTEMWGFRAAFVSCSSLTYDSAALVVLLCGNLAFGMMNLETRDSASAYVQRKRAGFGTAAVDLDLRYNFANFLNVAAVVGGELWVADIKAERADGSKLFQSRIPSLHVQLGLGASF